MLLERGADIDLAIRAAVAISAPCDLAECAAKLAEHSNRFYLRRFLYYMKKKMEHRRALFPDALDYDAVASARTFAEFDDLYTAPVHGFASAEDYWEQASAQRYAAGIRAPTLLLNS